MIRTWLVTGSGLGRNITEAAVAAAQALRAARQGVSRGIQRGTLAQ
jgi:hypothetical protein